MITETIPQLRSVVGRVIRPGEAAYDEARTVFIGGIDRRPAVIVRVADAADVANRSGLQRRRIGLRLPVADALGGLLHRLAPFLGS